MLVFVSAKYNYIYSGTSMNCVFPSLDLRWTARPVDDVGDPDQKQNKVSSDTLSESERFSQQKHIINQVIYDVGFGHSMDMSASVTCSCNHIRIWRYTCLCKDCVISAFQTAYFVSHLESGQQMPSVGFVLRRFLGGGTRSIYDSNVHTSERIV